MNNLHERLSRPISVYLTATEYEDIHDYAEEHNMSVSSLLIECIASHTGIEFQARNPLYPGARGA